MAEQERPPIITIEGEAPPTPFMDENAPQQIAQPSAEETLERRQLPPVVEEDQEKYRVLGDWWHAGRTVAKAAGSIALLGSLWYVVSGKWYTPIERKRREDSFEIAWANNLESPERLERQLSILFGGNLGLPKGVNLDDSTTWKYTFHDGAISLIRMIDALMDPKQRGNVEQGTGLVSKVDNDEARKLISGLPNKQLEWPELRKYLQEKGFKDTYLTLMEELWKEKKTVNGSVKATWEQIKKTGLLAPDKVLAAAYAADVAKVWHEAQKRGARGKLKRRDFLRGLTAPHFRKVAAQAIKEIVEE